MAESPRRRRRSCTRSGRFASRAESPAWRISSSRRLRGSERLRAATGRQGNNCSAVFSGALGKEIERLRILSSRRRRVPVFTKVAGDQWRCDCRWRWCTARHPLLNRSGVSNRRRTGTLDLALCLRADRSKQPHPHPGRPGPQAQLEGVHRAALSGPQAQLEGVHRAASLWLASGPLHPLEGEGEKRNP